MTEHIIKIDLKEIHYRWNDTVRYFPETEIEKVSGWSFGNLAYVKVRKKAGYKNPLLYNGMLCILKRLEDTTLIYSFRLYGLINFPDFIIQWLCIVCFLLLIRPEGITMLNCVWLACVIVAFLVTVTAIYSRYSSLGRHETTILTAFFHHFISKE